MPRGRPRKSPDVLKSAELIGWALGGLEREIIATKDRLAALSAQAAALRKKMGKSAPAAEGGPTRRRRTMSPEARKRISEMMKKRWAERRKGK